MFAISSQCYTFSGILINYNLVKFDRLTNWLRSVDIFSLSIPNWGYLMQSIVSCDNEGTYSSNLPIMLEGDSM